MLPTPRIEVTGPDGDPVDGLGETEQTADDVADVAPTVLDLMGLPLPPEMTGQSLIEKPAP